MLLVIPISSTQEEFEELVMKNPGITTLDCKNCHNITHIPKIDNLEQLDCSNCILITNLPHLDNLLYLTCIGCYQLTYIPPFKNLTYLVCCCCANLTYIPQLDNLTLLDCKNCKNLEHIPKLGLLVWLDCTNCLSLTRIPHLPKLQIISYLFCPQLIYKNIGYLPNISRGVSEHFKIQNSYYHWLKILKPTIIKLLGTYEGFAHEFIKILDEY